jgi:hypothetical protein
MAPPAGLAEIRQLLYISISLVHWMALTQACDGNAAQLRD